MPSSLTALGKAAVILESLDQPARLKDVARATHLPTPTVHRILHEMATLGWVRHEDNRTWAATTRAPGGGR